MWIKSKNTLYVQRSTLFKSRLSLQFFAAIVLWFQLSLHMQFYALCSSSNATTAKKKIAHIFKLPITLLGVLKAIFFRFSRLSVIIIILLLEKIVHSCFFKLISAALLWLCQTNEKLLKNAPNPVPKRHGGKNTSHVICEKWTSFKKHTFFRCSEPSVWPSSTYSFIFAALQVTTH